MRDPEKIGKHNILLMCTSVLNQCKLVQKTKQSCIERALDSGSSPE